MAQSSCVCSAHTFPLQRSKLDVFVWRRVKSGCGLDAGWRLTRVRWDASISPRCVLCFSFCFIYRLMFIIPKRCLHAFNVQKHFMILQFYKCSVWVSVALKPSFQNSNSTLIGQLWWHKQGKVGDIAEHFVGFLTKALPEATTGWLHVASIPEGAHWSHSRADVGLDGVICHYLFCCWQHEQEEVDENRFVWNVSLLKQLS